MCSCLLLLFLSLLGSGFLDLLSLTAGSEGNGGGIRNDNTHLGDHLHLLSACADHWVVFVQHILDLLFETELEGEVPGSSDEVPEVVSKVGDGASSGVQGSNLVEGQLSSELILGDTNETGDGTDGIGDEELETVIGEGNGSSDALLNGAASTLHVFHFVLFICLIINYKFNSIVIF